jgi:hypothetical protein
MVLKAEGANTGVENSVRTATAGNDIAFTDQFLLNITSAKENYSL